MSISIQPTPINPSSIHAQFTSAAIRHFVSNIAVAVVRVSVQFTSRLRWGMFCAMPSGPFAVPARPRPLDERRLYKRGVKLGFDGGLVDDMMHVFVVPRYRCSHGQAIEEIDYFHGVVGGMPMCQTMEDEIDYPAIALVGSSGFVGKCVIHIQRRWRGLRAKRYGKSMVKFGLLLANAWRRGRKLPDQIGPCQRKRKQSDPSRGGGEPSYQSQRRS